MSTTAGNSGEKRNKRPQRESGWMAEAARQIGDSVQRISAAGIVTIFVILGSEALAGWFQMNEWSSVLISLGGLSLFLAYDLMVRRIS